MRAIAVIAVVVYHMQPGWLPGGFFGVDIFFVISGYLITSMLGEEWAGSGRIQLRRFWLRRIRRLYPAVVALVVVLVPVAAIVAPTALSSMRTTIPAALVYLTNWWFIFHRVPYFQTFGRPPLLIHFWSLAIEEQYYLIWPPVLVVLLARWRRPRRIAAAALVAALASSVLMAVIYHGSGDINRIYFGSDTHAQGLLLGSALGLAVSPFHLSPAVSAAGRRLLDRLGAGSIVALIVIMALIGQNGGFAWRGGMVLVVLLAGVAVVVAAHPASRMPRVLGVRPLRWVGTRSYSIYLWHWPIIDLTRPVDVGFGGLPLTLIRTGLILGVSELSYRYVEQPWRTGQAERFVRELLARSRRQRQAAMAGAACVGVAVVALVVTAPSSTPPPSIREGATPAAKAPIVAVSPLTTTTTTTVPRRRPSRLGSTSTSAGTSTTTTTGSTTTTTGPTTTTVATTVPTTVPPTVPTTVVPALVPGAIVKAPPGRPVLAIGDSVMVAASDDLSQAFGRAITVDAAVGRQVDDGLQRLAQYKAAGRLRGLRALVIGLGTNGPFEANQIRPLLSLSKGIPRVVLINVRVPESWQSTSNATIASLARRPGFSVVDWYGASANRGYLYPDAIHPDLAGEVVYSNLVVKAVSGR